MRIYERKKILERNINYSNAYGRNLLQVKGTKRSVYK